MLIALVVIPAVAGTLRLIEMAGGPQLMPANARLTASPAPIIVHIFAAIGVRRPGGLPILRACAAATPRGTAGPAGCW